MNFFNLFGGHGGGGHMDDDDDPRMHMRGGPKKEVDNSQLYDFLGVAKDANDAQIKKAYFEKARIYHPDKGGDPEKFKEIQLAKEVLSDPEKRKIYDRMGIEGLQNGGGGGGGDMFDIFDLINGGGGRGRQQQGPKKHKGVKKELKITLENAYNGDMMKIPHQKQKNCDECDGKGGANVQTCGTCKGRGVIEKMVMLGPGMYQQLRQHCSECKGEGKICKEKDRCKTCKGEKVMNVKKDLEVAVEKGVPDRHVIVLHGEGDEAPELMAGDVHLVITIKDHPTFSRVGADLFMKKKISLLEALTGFHTTVEHLDGSKFIISSIPGEIIEEGQKKVIKNKGMPFYRDQMSHGNLIVEFNVEFPKPNELKGEQLDALKKILPGKQQPPLDKNQKYFMLEDFDATETNPNEEGGRKQEEDDDERGHPGAQQVQCGQQ